MNRCDRCGLTDHPVGLIRLTPLLVMRLCTTCGGFMKSERPLSPYEFITGERFLDHLTKADTILDRKLRR
jgi:hypothetical protein